MLFNSMEFLVFLPVVFSIYWLINGKSLKTQNTFLVAASYVFYGWWDWRFLSLIAFSSLIIYFIGLWLGKTEDTKKRKLLLLTSIAVNVGILIFFKYFNFFAENFQEVFTFLGAPISNPITINVILPIGISFYTFQMLSYSIDIYRQKIQPTENMVSFFAFVSFFPQLIAGPIERASNLLPQFDRQRVFNYDVASDGMRQLLWGLFKKVVIADNCANYANDIFLNYPKYSGSTLFLGVIFFTFQIYGDFSGYSDIAIGTSRLFGFNLMRNFAFPYFSRDIAEFWRRWHISLSTWFRDYIYIPLGGSRGGKWINIRNVFIIFVISGFWHGANWTFIVWGALNAVYFLPIMLMNRNQVHTNTVAENAILPNAKEIAQMAITFLFTVMAWVFFRSESVIDAFLYLSKMLSFSFFTYPDVFPKKAIFIVAVFLLIEWFQRDKQHALQFKKLNQKPLFIRWGVYYAIVFSILMLGGKQQEFIYFQF